ncbi:flagellar protein FlgN [Caloramator sp. Dgby_cultured_2]|uniref:flagellar protein FlgN n=2 Tax=unclassified Caloramator TaxID=2629145 RepID=UPI00237D8380|nr:flagellar protein FlgN [Caloramator sp. Dgby_cultured_2]WDU83942.1 flagellar protein FlgN [Caloramator sp. Dgby_cultured_2]
MMDIKELFLEFINLFLQLTELLDKEREALIKDQGEIIASLLETKKDIAININKLEGERQRLLKDKKIQDLVKEGLISEDLAREFERLALEVKEKNETNLALTKQSLSYIRMMNNILSPNKSVTYNPTGEINAKSSSNIFNATV